jgi:hypothetical protein
MLTPSAAWYPNWSTSSCVNDGQEPDWQATEPTAAACCSTNFSWSPNCEAASLNTPPAAAWYPNYATSYCVNDGQQPSWQATDLTAADCCINNFSWNSVCESSSLNPPTTATPPTSAPAGSWYPNYSLNLCVDDGQQPDWQTTEATVQDCCATNFAWSKKCVSKSLNTTPPNAWYPNYATSFCVNDGQQPDWQATEATAADCCSTNFSWNNDCVANSV